MTGAAGSRARAARYGRLFGEIAVVSGLGILATAGFQLVVIRGLGSVDYGVLAALLALVNVVSVGSAALRNSAAVTTARSAPTETAPRRVDPTLVEALVLGLLGTLLLVVVAASLAGAVDAGWIAVALLAGTSVPYFFFARAQGRLQGLGLARSVVWWSTGAQVAQLLLAVLVIALGLGVNGVLAVLVVTAVLGAILASRQARGAPRGVGPAFSRSSTIVLLATIAFTWLTSADVVIIKAGAEGAVAGAYAAAAILVKTTLIVPATLSLYLLPRLAAAGSDTRFARSSVGWTLLATLIGGLAMVVVTAIAGAPIAALVFGPGYGESATLLPWVAVMWLPWAVAQAALIRALATASAGALSGLAVAVVAQWIVVGAVLPDIEAALVANGVIGCATAGWLLLVQVLDLRKGRRPEVGSQTSEPGGEDEGGGAANSASHDSGPAR